MEAALVAFGVVLVAELGDKSQLLALAFATRHPPVPVFIGIAVSTAALNAVSVAVGAAFASALPERAMGIAGGLAFLAFGVWTLRSDGDGLVGPVRQSAAPVVASVALAFLVAELGDKTMVATVTLAAQGSALATWVGATVAMMAVNGVAVAVGRSLGARFPERSLRLAGAAVFLVFGAVLLTRGLMS